MNRVVGLQIYKETINDNQPNNKHTTTTDKVPKQH